MKTTTVEALVWVLIYFGLLGLVVGLFIWRGGALHLGGWMMALGAGGVVAGLGLLVWRSRMDEPALIRPPR